MRTTFIKKLVELTDSRTHLLVGDLGYSVVEPFQEKYPKQFLNVGVAEQNMTGIAAGLALAGQRVFTYSIANFNTLRCLEQIRNDICYHNLDVTIVSVGGGLAYGSLGYSHHAVQDIAILGSLPNMTLYLPGDPREVEFCMERIFRETGPKYLRLGRGKEPRLHGDTAVLEEINCFNPREKSDVALISVGSILPTSFEVQKILEKRGIACRVYSCLMVGKDFKRNIYRKMKNTKHLFTLEEHISDLGFGSLVRGALEDSDTRVKSFGLQRDLCKLTGSPEYLCERHGMGAASIARQIQDVLSKKR